MSTISYAVRIMLLIGWILIGWESEQSYEGFVIELILNLQFVFGIKVPQAVDYKCFQNAELARYTYKKKKKRNYKESHKNILKINDIIIINSHLE